MRAITDILERNVSELARLLTHEQVMATSVFFRNYRFGGS
jgi:hypothetical protein